MKPISREWQPRCSARLYLSILLVGSVLGLWASYLLPAQPVFKGQALGLLIGILSIAASTVFWAALEKRSPARGTLAWFLVTLAITWVVHLAVFRLHADAFTYAAFGLPIILFMLWRKPPSVQEGVSAIRAMAWSISFVLVATLVLEMTGVIAQKYQHWQIIRFDESYYWLPLNHLLGIEGRWPGPFGHNGYTAMMGAFLIIIAIGFWNRASVVFIAVGALTLSVTAGRASVGAALAGIVIVGMLTRTKPLNKIPASVRLAAGSAFLLAGLFLLLSGRAGLTGRQNIWPAFFELWQSSPWTGVGSEVIRTSGGVVGQYGHAHSLYLDTLTRYGLVSLVAVLGALGIGLWIAIKAGNLGLPGPLALLIGYVIIGFTEPRNDWLHPGTLVLLVITSVMVAGAAVASSRDRLMTDPRTSHGERNVRGLN